MNEHLRQTGRTTRMLHQALALCNQGRAVYVFTQRGNVRGLQGQASEIARKLRLPGGWPDSVKIESMPDDFDWEAMRVPRSHRNCAFLVDHFVVEMELQQLDEKILRLQQLARQMYHLTTN